MQQRFEPFLWRVRASGALALCLACALGWFANPREAGAAPAPAPAVQQGTAFANSIAPTSSSQLVNPAGVNPAAWGPAASTPSSIPVHLGGFTTPLTTSTAYTAARSGGLTPLGTQAMVSCANFVPSANADPLQVQACAAVNFMTNNCMTPSTQQAGVIAHLGATQITGGNCYGTYGAGVQSFNMASQVTPADSIFTVVNTLKSTAPAVVANNCTTQNVVTTPAQFALNTCTKNTDTSVENCSQFLSATVVTTQTLANPTESCPNGTLVGNYCQATTTGAAAVTYVCPAGQTLQGNQCIGPNGSTPAIVASYTCPTGQTLSGTNCVADLTTVVGGATQNISCPTGSTWNGTACQSTLVTSATLPVGVICQDGYGYVPSDYVLSGTTCQFPNGDQGPYTLNTLVPGCTGLNDFTTYIGGIRMEIQAGQCTWRITDRLGGHSCPIPNPARYVLLNTTTPGPAGYVNTSTGLCTYLPAVIYSCPVGYVLDTNNNCVGATTTTAIVSSYFCPTGGAYVNGSCSTTVLATATITYSCPTGQVVSGNQCTQTVVTTVPATPVYSCPAGATLSGALCIAAGQTTPANVTYSCPAGSVLSGSQCTTTTVTPATVTYSCSDGSAAIAGICRIRSVQSAWTDTCVPYEARAGTPLPLP